MKKILLYVTLIVMLFGIKDVKAATVNSADISPSTYVIGKYMYTRNVNQESNYDGRLTTQRIMLASRTISGTDESGMIIYYKTASGKWINALTGQNITVPTTFEVEVTDLVKEGNITLTNPNYETQELDKGDIYPSTYVIGDYIYTRNSNKKYNYDGKLTTQRIMLASKTLTSDKEEDMIIYYKTARGIWIDALTGQEVTPTQKLNISTVDLINQKNDNMEVYLSSGTVFNQKIKQLAGNANATYETNDVKITKVKKAESINLSNLSSNNIISTDESDVPLYVWYDNGTIYYYPLHYFDNVKIYLNSLSNFMFYNLSKVTEIDISNFDTSKATNMSSMFSGCSSLTYIDFSNFDMSKVTNLDSMLTNTTSLAKIKTPKVNPTIELNIGQTMYDASNNEYTKIDSTTPTKTIIRLRSTLIEGLKFNAKIKQLAGNANANYSTKDENITKIKRETNVNNIPSGVIGNSNNIVSLDSSYYPVYVWYKNGVIYYYTEDAKIALNKTSSNMFNNLSKVIEIDLTDFDTSNVTNMSNMFYGCSSLRSVDLSSFDLSKVTSVSSMLSNTTSLVEIKTPKVNPTIELSIGKTLYDASNNEYTKINSTTPTKTIIKTRTELLNGSQFNIKIKQLAGNDDATTSTIDKNITKIIRETNINNIPSGVIGNNDNLVSQDYSYYPVYAWYKSGVIYYYTEDAKIYLNKSSSYMFGNLSKVIEIDLTDFNTSNVTNMSYMFYGCSSLKSIDLSSFDMSKVTSVSVMVSGTTSLAEMKTPKVNPLIELSIGKTMYDSSNNEYTKINSTTPTKIIIKTRTELLDGSIFNAKIKQLAGNVDATYSTIDENITKIKRETNINNIPNGVIGNNDNLVSQYYSYYPVYAWYKNGVIYYYTEDEKIYLNKTSNRMFYNLSNVIEIDLTVFDTSNVTNMSYMFYGCSSLTNIDLSNFNTSNVTSMSSMFNKCSSLTNIDLSNFNTSNVTDVSVMFQGCKSLKSIDLSSFDLSNVSSVTNMLGNLTMLKELKTPKVNSSIDITLPKSLYGDNIEYNVLTSNTPKMTLLKVSTRLVDGSSFNVKIKKLAGNPSATRLDTDNNITKIKRETNRNNMPSGVIGNDNNIVSVADSYYPIYVWYSNGIIYYYSDDNIIYLNEDCSYMFYAFYKLEEIDLNNIYSNSKLEYTHFMFSRCVSLISLDLSNFDMSMVNNVSDMFLSLSSLQRLKTPKVNSSLDITLPKSLYDSNGNEYTKLTSSTPTRTVITTRHIAIMATGKDFNSKVKQLAGNSNPTFSTVNTNITKILRETNVNNVPSGVIGNSNYLISKGDSYYPIYAWFSNGIIYYYCEDTTIYLSSDSAYMFANLSSVTEIKLNNFDTSNVTDMMQMFSGCKSLTSLNLSNFDTSKVKYMHGMFRDCSSLTSLNLSNFNTSNVIYMAFMFMGCSNLTSLNISNFNTSNVTGLHGMHSMFRGCSSLTSLNLSSFDTSNVTNMSSMFFGCSSLTSLNLSNFSTSNVTSTSEMFYGCSSLASLNLSSFNTSNVTDMSSMFRGCSSLSYLDLNHFITSNVTDMSGMFLGCTSLSNLMISNFNTSKVTSMSYMFDGCVSIKNLNLSHFNTSQVTTMLDMFYGCSNLTSLNVSNFDVSKVTDMGSMFEGCSKLTSLNLSSFVTSQLTNAHRMFKDCSSLTSINVSNFNTSNVTDMMQMFENCSKLTTLDLSSFNTTNVTSMGYMFNGCTSVTTAYARTNTDASKLNSSYYKPSNVTFVVKP